MDLSNALVKEFYCAKEFSGDNSISSAQYSPTGESLCVSINRKLKIYNVLKGSISNIISLDASVFTHVTGTNILYSSDRNIDFLSLHDNKVISNFKSHTEKVSYISSGMYGDTFLSSCRDSVKMWDLSCKNPVYSLDINNATASFVEKNFIVCTNSLLSLYDVRYASGPYSTSLIPLSEYKKVSTTTTCFCISSKNVHRVYDTEGLLLHDLKTERSSFTTLSPDSKYLICTSGSFLFWIDIESKERVHTMREESMNFGLVEFNPVYAQMATLFFNLRLWLPKAH